MSDEVRRTPVRNIVIAILIVLLILLVIGGVMQALVQPGN